MSPVLVACSGGADSLALLAATVFEAREEALRVIGVTVDHGLQEGSADHAMRVVAQMATARCRRDRDRSPVTVDPGGQGIEAAAREARYAALAQIAEHFGAHVVLLGHTLDDQAETVLLGLARGSGARSLSADARLDRRPRSTGRCSDVTRAQTEAACRAEGIEWWEDPHNADPRFSRSRVRHTVMPMLERELGPGIAEALARTGEQLRDDMDFMEPFELEAYARARTDDGIDMLAIDDVGDAIRSRCARRAAIDQGAIASELTRAHVLAVLGLLGQKGKADPAPRPRHGVRRGRGAALRRTVQAG